MRLGLVFAAFLATHICALPLDAQDFRGKGHRTTEPFALDSGDFVARLTHRGNDEFTVRLLDENGTLIKRLVVGLGPFNGSAEFTIPQRGWFRLDVDADDEWSARIRSVAALAAEKAGLTPEGADSLDYEEGQAAGQSAAAGIGFQWGWAAKGLVGGTVTGPLGLAFVSSRAAGSDAELPGAAKAEPSRGAHYLQGYQQGFLDRVRARRKEAAVVGGLIGTGIFAYAIIRLVDLRGSNPDGPPPKPKPGG